MTEKSEYYHLPEGEMFLITQKALVTDNGRLLVLKVHHDEGQVWSDKWQLPGGLLDIGESLKDGLKREVREETGLEITVGKPVGTGDWRYNGFVFEDGRSYNVRAVSIAYECLLSENKEIRLSHEHTDYLWATKEELQKLEKSIMKSKMKG